MKLVIPLILFSQFLMASTFVGNGGNAGDIELAVSKTVISKTLDAIIKGQTAEGNLCTCPESFKGLPLCQGVSQLNEEKVKFCQKMLVDYAQESYNRISNTINFSWTDQNLIVKELGQNMSVDALAMVLEEKILLQKDRFLQRESYERNFLVSHELFHFIKLGNSNESQRHHLIDEQKIGPFTSETGGRELLNAMASAIVIESNRLEIATLHNKDLNRSRKIVANYLVLNFTQSKAKEDYNTSYVPTSYSGTSFEYNHYFTDSLGLGARYLDNTAKDTFLNSVEAKEDQRILGARALYRFGLSDNLLSTLGQSFVQLHGGVDFMTTQFKLDEPPIHQSESQSTNYLTAGSTFFIPMSSGLWIQFGIEYNQPTYEYSKNLDAKYSTGRTTTSLGASYGF